MIYWMHLPLKDVVHYPTCLVTSPAASVTTTAGSSGLLTAVETTIKSIQIGSTHTLGTLTIADHAGTTVRTIATPNASTSNMSVNAAFMNFTIAGGFSVSCSSATACDLYIQFEFVPRRT